jgi:large subunit ribosomal protein L13
MQKTAEVQRQWHLVDVKDQVLGRIASEIATKLIGKHKPTYTPHIDAGDYVVVVNAAAVAVTGKKMSDKIYYSHSGFPGGLKEITLENLLKKFPTRVIEKAVYNMLPKNKLRADRMKRLKIYAGLEHKHHSQLGIDTNK